MNKYEAMYQSKSRFLKAADIDEPPVIVTVDSYFDEQFDDGERLVIVFKEFEKGVVLNKTNYEAMSNMFKSLDPQDWMNKECLLQVEPVTFQGKTVDAIRIKPHRQPRRAHKQERQAAKPPPDDFDDDIDF